MYGMCHQRQHHRSGHLGWDDEERGSTLVRDRSGQGAPPPRDPAQRVTDVDRERAAALLSQAFRDGLLRVEEFDQRLSGVFAATTAGELDAAMADLPDGWVSEVRSFEEKQQRAERHRREWRAGLQVYLRVMTLLVGIWLVTAFANAGDAHGLLYFWPAWPMVFWGMSLFMGRPRDRSTMPPWHSQRNSRPT